MQLINIVPRARKEVSARRNADLPTLLSDFDSPWLEMERMFDRMFHLTPAMSGGETNLGFSPSLDLHETEKEFQINVEIPGMTANDIDISITKNVLTISGEKKEEKEENIRGSYRLERRYGSFSRSIPMPENSVDFDKTEAAYKDGVLTIKLPKATEFKEEGKKIPVQSSKVEDKQSKAEASK